MNHPKLLILLSALLLSTFAVKGQQVLIRAGRFIDTNKKIVKKNVDILVEGDRLQIGPWMMQVGTMEATTVSLPTAPDEEEVEQRVKRIDPSDVAALARHRLSLFIECAGLINQATNEAEQADAIVTSALEGTGFGRGALLRARGEGDQVEVLHYKLAGDAPGTFDTFSRSLIKAASQGDMVSLLSDAQPDYGQSIAELNIHSRTSYLAKIRNPNPALETEGT